MALTWEHLYGKGTIMAAGTEAAAVGDVPGEGSPPPPWDAAPASAPGWCEADKWEDMPERCADKSTARSYSLLLEIGGPITDAGYQHPIRTLFILHLRLFPQRPSQMLSPHSRPSDDTSALCTISPPLMMSPKLPLPPYCISRLSTLPPSHVTIDASVCCNAIRTKQSCSCAPENVAGALCDQVKEAFCPGQVCKGVQEVGTDSEGLFMT